MVDHDKIRPLNFDKINSTVEIEYNDGDIAYHNDIRELPIENGTLKVDIYILLACTGGKGQMNLNTASYTIEKNHLLLLRPNDLISNYMMSPDFSAAILCISQRILTELFSESDLWDNAFYFRDHFEIITSDESLELFRSYAKIAQAKIKSGQKRYQKEIIHSLMRAVFFEILSDIPPRNTCGNSLIKQTDVLFKKFIQLLTELKAKPRSVAWYADKLNVSSKHLSTVSRRVSGKTAFEWINEYVKKDITNYLRNTTLSIKEIVNILDFSNLSFFGKYCRRNFGASPTVLRRQLRETI